MLDVKANNWILPCATDEVVPAGDEFWHDRHVQELGILARARYEQTPIFNETQHTFWPERFKCWNTRTCVKALRLAEVPIPPDKKVADLRMMLVTHYQRRIEDLTTPKYYVTAKEY